MKKVRVFLSFLLLFVLCASALTGCGTFGGKSKEYIIQYTDDTGTHQLSVTADMPYSLETVPSRNGYVFTGLYDAEVGGTQYVSANGASLAPFTDGKNIVLFPHFAAKEYTVILDYQGAAVTGSRQLTVSYGSTLPELPKNLTQDHKKFTGWYTAAEGAGTQVADEYGLIPVVSVLNETNFDLGGEYVYLYAGFETEKFTVTCHFEAGVDTEKVKVEYDTPVSQIVPKTRVDGNAPFTWSKTQGGEAFTGKITGDTVLYALEYAPVIDFDSDGGSEVHSIVARAGSAVTLPTPTKDLAKFSYWQDTDGKQYTSSTMPNKSISLKAVWQAKIVFDENGGSDVNDVSVATGSKITLPTPERNGYIFAGWYTADKEQYTSSTMPAAGIALKAGWYQMKETTVIQCTGDTILYFSHMNTPKMANSLTVDLSSILPNNFSGTIKIDANFQARESYASLSSPHNIVLYYYSSSAVSDSNLLFSENFVITSSSFSKFSYSQTIHLEGNMLYGAYKTSNADHHDITDYYLKITYPDTFNLYL